MYFAHLKTANGITCQILWGHGISYGGIMVKGELTDSKISELLLVEKRVMNPMVRKKIEGRHERVDYKIISIDEQYNFSLYTRQSTRLITNFSVGLRWVRRNEEDVMLIRCNGSNHRHTNAIENNAIHCVCHIHLATERYLSSSMPDDGFAKETNEYTNLDGALLYLIKKCNIGGFAPDAGLQTFLF